MVTGVEQFQQQNASSPWEFSPVLQRWIKTMQYSGNTAPMTQNNNQNLQNSETHSNSLQENGQKHDAASSYLDETERLF
jgi:hypothetical protein